MKRGKEELLSSQVCSSISSEDSFTANSLSIIAIYSRIHSVLSHKPTADISTDHTNKPVCFITTDTNDTGHITFGSANNRLQI